MRHFLTPLALASILTTPSPALSRPTQQPPHQSGGDEYLVIIDKSNPIPPGVADVLARLDLDESHADVRHIFNNTAFTGFAASMQHHCLDLLANMTDIRRVEKSVTVQHVSALPDHDHEHSHHHHHPPHHPPSSPPHPPLTPRHDPALAYSTRPNAPWGLQALSTAGHPIHGDPRAIDYTYAFPTQDLGRDVDIYILDTGLYTAHDVFSSSSSSSSSSPRPRAQTLWSYDPTNPHDLDGHGTHVAGTAAGAWLGVASAANVFGVKVMSGSGGGGWSSDVVKGIDVVVRRHDERRAAAADAQAEGATGAAAEEEEEEDEDDDDDAEGAGLGSGSGSSGFKGSVMSLSLAAAGLVGAIDEAVEAAVARGVHVVVAAGNEGRDACGASPAAGGGTRGPAITVGAVGMEGRRSGFSNWGDCVDVFAPGEEIVSAWVGGEGGEARNWVRALSGTSMAAPHVTGLVACAMGNATLAGGTGLMKEWVRMMGVRGLGGDGVVVASNGVRVAAGEGEGMVELESGVWRRSEGWEMEEGRRAGGLWRRWVDRVRGVVDPLMGCRRAAQMRGDVSLLRGGIWCTPTKPGLVR